MIMQLLYMRALICNVKYLRDNLNRLCRPADFQGAPAEKLLPQRHRGGRLDGKHHTGAEQQHRDGGCPGAAQHRAALSGSHGRDLFYCFLPAQVQEQRILPWKGETHIHFKTPVLQH